MDIHTRQFGTLANCGLLSSDFRLRTSVCAVPLALVAAILTGCGGGGPERVIVSGTVTFNEQPLEQGTIRFRPIEGTQAPSGGAQIVAGKYTVDARGGLDVGTYQVTIVAERIDPAYDGPVETESIDLQRGPPRQQYIPARYNTRSELRLTIEPGSGPLTKDFELTP